MGDRYSTSAWLITITAAGACVAWGSTKQKCVALSTAEAEIIALSEAAKEVVILYSPVPRDSLSHEFLPSIVSRLSSLFGVAELRPKLAL